MKTLLHCLSLLLIATVPMQAEVIVYKATQKTRYVGNSVDIKIPATGFLILDATALTGHSVGVYNVRGDKFFSVVPFERNLRTYSIAGPLGRTYTAWVASGITNMASEFRDSAEYGIGTDADLAISPTNTVRRPRTVQINYGGVVIPTGGQTLMALGSGVASYSQKETRLANSLGEDADATLDRIREVLLASGYREIVEGE